MYDDGEHISDPIHENRLWYNYITKGSFINSRTDENSTPPNLSLPDTSAGDFWTPEDFNYFHGTHKLDVSGNTTIWCLCGENNRDYVPEVEKWFLASGESTSIPVGTKLFFCQGDITINGNTTINSPTEIVVKTANTTATATEDSYAIKFL